MDRIEENRLLRIDEVRRLTTFSQVHVYRLIKSGKFPRPVQIGVRRVGWRAQEIFSWLAERSKTQPTNPARENPT